MSVIDVLSSLHPQDKILVVFHGDADGCASASLFSLFLESIGSQYTLHTTDNGDPRILPGLVELARGYDYTIVLDIAHRPRDVYERLAEVTKVVIIDHHLDPEPFDVPGVVYYNPAVSEGRKAPVAYLVYEAINELGEFERLCWVCLLGVCGDKEQDRFPELMEETFARYPNLRGGPSYGDLAIIRFLLGIIACGRAYAGGKGATLAVGVLNEAARSEAPEHIVSGTKEAADLFGYRLSTNRVVRNLVDLHVDRAVLVPERALIFYPLESPLYIQNYVAGILSARRPEWVCAVANTGLEPGSALLELRTCRTGLNLLDVVSAACRGIEGAEVSGHPEAAHARLPAGSLDVARERLAQSLPGTAPPGDLGAPAWQKGARPPRRERIGLPLAGGACRAAPAPEGVEGSGAPGPDREE